MIDKLEYLDDGDTKYPMAYDLIVKIYNYSPCVMW